VSCRPPTHSLLKLLRSGWHSPPLPAPRHLHPCPVCPHLDATFEPFRLAAYWQSMHQRALAREQQLRLDIDALRAQLRLREHQLFGTRTESSSTPDSAPQHQTTPKKARGQQPGKPGHQRRDHSHLPAVVEIRDLPDDAQHCSACGDPFEPFAGTEDSEVLEVEVRAYRRVIRRKRYRPTCSCGRHPGIVTAPSADKVFPRSTLVVPQTIASAAAVEKGEPNVAAERSSPAAAGMGWATCPGNQ